MVYLFGVKWNFVTVRCGRRIFCNRAKRYGNNNTSSFKKASSISYGCDYIIIFKVVTSEKCTIFYTVEVVQVCWLDTNTCDQIFADQYIVVRIRSREYNNVLI